MSYRFVRRSDFDLAHRQYGKYRSSMSVASEQHPRYFMGPRAEGSVVERAIGAEDFLQRGSDDQCLATFQYGACFTALEYISHHAGPIKNCFLRTVISARSSRMPDTIQRPRLHRALNFCRRCASTSVSCRRSHQASI